MAAGMRLLQAFAAAGRATGRQRCPLPRQPLGALLGLGSRAVVVRPSSLVLAFSTNAVDGEGAAIAGGKGAPAVGGRFKIADAGVGNTARSAGDVKAEAFGVSNTAPSAMKAEAFVAGNAAAAEEGAGVVVSMGEMDAKVKAFGVGSTIGEAEEEGAGEVVSMGEMDPKVKAFGAGSTIGEAEEEGSGEVVSMGEMDPKVEAFGAESTIGEAEEEGAGDIKEKGDEDVGGVTALSSKTVFCLYDEPGLKMFMEKFIAEKTVDSAMYVPGLTESLEFERTKHRKERLHTDLRHLVHTLLGVVLEVMAVALLELYLETQVGEKERNKKKEDEEVLDDEKKLALPLFLFLF